MYLDRMRAKAEGGRRVEGRGWRVEGRRRGEVSMKSETRAWKRPKKYGTAGSEGQGWFGWFDFQVDQCWAGQGAPNSHPVSIDPSSSFKTAT